MREIEHWKSINQTIKVHLKLHLPIDSNGIQAINCFICFGQNMATNEYFKKQIL